MATYKIRRVNKGGPTEACSLAVPAEIAQKLPEGIRFKVRLTEEGILYYPIKGDEPSETPAWVKEAE